MQKNNTLMIGSYYHIYNCGINGLNIFNDNNDFKKFLSLYDKYIDPIAETFSWCLMGNHFHLLVRLKEGMVYKYSMDDKSRKDIDFNEIKWETTSSKSSNTKLPDPTNHFSHLFTSYSKYFNIKYKRHGALFERPFKRKLVDNEVYFQRLVLYIHNNPVHHKFTEHPIEWAWSSYYTILSDKPTKLYRKQVLDWFESKENYENTHSNSIDIIEIEKYLEL